MSIKTKSVKWLLVDVPQDIVDLVRDYQTKEMIKCNCRFGVKKSIVSLLRRAYPDRKAPNLQNATGTIPQN